MIIHKKYSILSISLMFLLFSHIAWLWEGFLMMFQYGKFVNRGFLHGFWLPIYGAGGVILILALGRRELSKWKVFLYSILICCSIEYATSFALEMLFHRKWWDYGQVWLNLHGRICFFVAVIFGILGYFLVIYIAPFLNKWIQKIPLWIRIAICLILGGMLVIDFIYSFYEPNMGKGITFS